MTPSITLVTRSTAPFVSASEAAAFCRVTDEGELGALASFVETAVNLVEDYTGLVLTANTYRWAAYGWPVEVRDQFPWYSPRPEVAGRIVLARSPLVSVQSVKYYDEAGTLTTLDPSSYTVDTVNTPGAVVLNPGVSIPAIQTSVRRADAVQIAFTAGPCTEARAKHAVLFWVRHLYDNREVLTPASMIETPMGLKHLLNSLRV